MVEVKSEAASQDTQEPKTSSTLAIVVSAVFILATAIPHDNSVSSVSAQNNNGNTTNSNSMNFAIDTLTKIHLLAANESLMNGDTTRAFSQVNLAYLQLAMIETDII
jgi:hypothetical protein